MNDIHPLLSELRRLTAEAQGEPPREEEADFSSLFRAAVEAVNRLQNQASGLAEAFERERPGVDLVDVVLAREKAGLAFQTLLQVRNKMIQAYQDIMNMPL